ncbi:MAG: IscS subfamily cysteine desulfurase [Myxococcota bacterium]
MKLPIYMDYAATTPVDSRVLEAMIPYFSEVFGNAASQSHIFGWKAAEAVQIGRERVAELINASPKEIIFTSGATESDNLALKGVADKYQSKGNHIITVKTEHKAILDTARYLEKKGFEVSYLNVNREGLINLDELTSAIKESTILVSVMAVNNEIGVIQPLREISEICKEKGVFFHTDAAQALGKIPLDVKALNIDLMSLSAHKAYGPKGIGALYVRAGRDAPKLEIQMHGGGHEKGRRSGTLNVPGIVGFGKACEIARNEMAEEHTRILKLRESLREQIQSGLEEVFVNGSLEHRVAGNLNMSFRFVEGEGLMLAIKDVAVSSGSACTSESLSPSHVISALGVSDELVHTSLRFSLGRFTTQEEIDYVARSVIREVKRLREMSPLYEMAREGVDISSVNWGKSNAH